MASRSVKALCIIPVLTAALVALTVWVTPLGLAAVTMERPDQQVQSFLSEATSGRVDAASRRVTTAFRHSIHIGTLGTRLQQRYGSIVTNSAEIRAWTPTRAEVWSETRTNAGNTYLIAWTLERAGDRWVIAGISEVQGIGGDVLTE